MQRVITFEFNSIDVHIIETIEQYYLFISTKDKVQSRIKTNCMLVREQTMIANIKMTADSIAIKK